MSRLMKNQHEKRTARGADSYRCASNARPALGFTGIATSCPQVGGLGFM